MQYNFQDKETIKSTFYGKIYQLNLSILSLAQLNLKYYKYGVRIRLNYMSDYPPQQDGNAIVDRFIHTTVFMSLMGVY